MYREVIQLHIYVYLFFFRFFSHIGYYRILSRVLVLGSMSLLIIFIIYTSMYILIPTPYLFPPHLSSWKP